MGIMEKAWKLLYSILEFYWGEGKRTWKLLVYWSYIGNDAKENGNYYSMLRLYRGYIAQDLRGLSRYV